MYSQELTIWPYSEHDRPLLFFNNLNFYGEGFLAPAQPRSWRAPHCQLSATTTLHFSVSWFRASYINKWKHQLDATILSILFHLILLSRRIKWNKILKIVASSWCFHLLLPSLSGNGLLHRQCEGPQCCGDKQPILKVTWALWTAKRIQWFMATATIGLISSGTLSNNKMSYVPGTQVLITYWNLLPVYF